MPLRSPIAWMTVLFLALLAGSGRAAGFVDAAERYVVVPDRVGRSDDREPGGGCPRLCAGSGEAYGLERSAVPRAAGLSPGEFRPVADRRRSGAAEPGGDRPSGRAAAPRPDHRGGPGHAGSCGARRTNPATDRGPLPRPRQQHRSDPPHFADHRCAARRRRARRRPSQIYRLRHRCSARQIADRAGRRSVRSSIMAADRTGSKPVSAARRRWPPSTRPGSSMSPPGSAAAS